MRLQLQFVQTYDFSIMCVGGEGGGVRGGGLPSVVAVRGGGGGGGGGGDYNYSEIIITICADI